MLNANYLLARVKDAYEVPYGDRCMHEFVASASTLRRERKISAMDIAKRLLDFGYHAPTVYFPLVVAGGAHDRADRDREQGNAGRLRRRAAARFARKIRSSCTRRRTPWGSAGPTKFGRPRSRSCGGRSNLPAACPSTVADGPHNMAADEVLLESAVTGVATSTLLRLVRADAQPGLLSAGQFAPRRRPPGLPSFRPPPYWWSNARPRS